MLIASKDVRGANVLKERRGPVALRLNRRVTRRQAIKAGGIAVIGLVFSTPVINTFRPKPVFANYFIPSGCTPGYWKNIRQHVWPTGFEPDFELFKDHFTIPATYLGSLDRDLLDVLKQGGGCEKALGRHASAALLNAVALGQSAFGLSEGQVKQMVNIALATEVCNTIESTKNSLMIFNEQSCPLGGNIADA